MLFGIGLIQLYSIFKKYIISINIQWFQLLDFTKIIKH